MREPLRSVELPSWPSIDYCAENGECVVHGKHVSYERFIFARFLLWFIRPAYLFGAACIGSLFEIPFRGFLVFLGLFIIFAFTIGRRKAGKWLCMLLFPKETRIEFTRDKIIVDGKTYENIPDIQFRSYRAHLPDEKFERMQLALSKGATMAGIDQKLKYRKIEMVYGLRLIPITSIENQDLADQFSVVLTLAYHQVANAPSFGFSSTGQKSAPAPRRMEEEGALE